MPLHIRVPQSATREPQIESRGVRKSFIDCGIAANEIATDAPVVGWGALATRPSNDEAASISRPAKVPATTAQTS